PDHRLTTFRAPAPHDHWPELGRLTHTPHPPHRARYHRYQGPVSGNRGTVTRVALGHAFALFWTNTRIRLTLHTDRLDATLDLRRLTDERWLAVVD
ncbi:MAG: hypothetical protein AAF797_06270, partial [Planctomycetota bacterium]